MSEPSQLLVPITTSPLRVRRRDGQLIAEDAAGGLVLIGRPGGSGPDDAMTIETAGGSWRIQRIVGSAQVVLDRAGNPVATRRRRALRSTLIELPGGESIPVTTGRLRLFGYGCRMSHLASARAPFFRPGRYFTFTLHDELLGRADRELLVALGAQVAHGVITTLIQSTDYTPS
jgi:hypothetical protein